jgi:hypothetical protein
LLTLLLAGATVALTSANERRFDVTDMLRGI